MEGLKCTVRSLTGQLKVMDSQEKEIQRIEDHEISTELYDAVLKRGKTLGVTERFRDVIREFHTPEGETPAGFQVVYELQPDGTRKLTEFDCSYEKCPNSGACLIYKEARDREG